MRVKKIPTQILVTFKLATPIRHTEQQKAAWFEIDFCVSLSVIPKGKLVAKKTSIFSLKCPHYIILSTPDVQNQVLSLIYLLIIFWDCENKIKKNIDLFYFH